MSREDNFLKDVIAKTKSRYVCWDSVSPGAHTEVIFQSPFAYIAFGAQYDHKEKTYYLLLVGKKFPSQNTDFEIIEEKFRAELLVLLDGKLISTLSDYSVSPELLGELMELAEQESSEAQDLFSDFSEDEED